MGELEQSRLIARSALREGSVVASHQKTHTTLQTPPATEMLRHGKASGWLSLAPEAFHPWAQLNGVRFHEVKPGRIEGRGSALLAAKDVVNSTQGAECLLTVPKDLILGQEQVHEQAKVDRDFREFLESLGDFGRVGDGFPPIYLTSSEATDSNPSLAE